jgi:uncharacterized protein YkwD/tRNA A-37 threonylcarbamoyl transferase component Bud32
MSSKGNSRYKEVYILKNPNYSIKIKPFDKPKKGGEGEIYQVLDSPLVAKIYYEEKLKPDHQKKLPILLETAEKLTIPKRNSFQIAWCVDLVYDSPKRNRIIGFLMQFVPGEKIVKAYNPQERQKYFPHFNYGYLHQIAINLAKVFQEIHKHNIVMGDVNESNFLVTDYAEVILIDIDSVQIYDTRESKHYKCTVGTTGYKPPELESYERVRKPEHDLYGLGVLIYKLLMGGMDPFPEVEGEKSSVYKHPRLALPFETLHPQVRYLMQLFTNDGYKNPQKRPTAESWVLALQEAEESLKRCSNNERHYYQQHLQKCIWCERAWELKKDTFLPKLGYKFYDPTKTPPPPTPRPTPRPTPPPTPRPTPRPYIPITSRSTSRPTSISTPQRNIPIPSSSKILVQNNKTRRQILILGGLAGSGLVAAALTRNLWEQLFSKSIPTSQPIPKTTPEKISISEAIPSPTPPPRPKIPIRKNDLEKSVFSQINQYRKSQNLPALQWNNTIAEQARIHAQQMASGKTTFSNDGFQFQVEVISQKIPYKSVARNIAKNRGYSNPGEKAVEGWINNSVTNKSIVDDHNLTGIGIAQNSKGEYYFSQLFIKTR